MGNGLLWTFVSGIAIIAISYICGDNLLWLIGATNENIQMAHNYGFIIYAMMPLAMVQNALAAIIRADGSPRYSMLAMTVGAVINIVGDPLCISVWGIQGAAVATVFGQFVSFIICANCKCKLDTCTVELSESERRSGWKPLASVLGDAAAAFGCVNRVEELVKQLLRGAVAKLLARPSVQFISCSQDILSRESLNGHALRNEGSKQPVVTFVLGTFPRGVGMRKVDCTAPVLDLTERRELRAVVHGNGLEDL